MTNLSTIIKTRCIALTGGIATGKSTVAEIIREHGFIVFDADEFARNVVSPGSETLASIAKIFGTAILLPDGSLDRQKLRELIAQNPAARGQLDAVMHPAIREEFFRQVAAENLEKNTKDFFYEAALIHETGRAGDFKATWCTLCSKDEQIARIIHRSHGNIENSQAQALIATQMPANEKASRSNITINTSGSINEIKKHVDQLLLTLRR